MIRFLDAFIRTRWLARTLKTRMDVERWQARRLGRFLHNTLPKFRFYQPLRTERLQDLPVIDKARLMSDFGAFNSAGISTTEGWKIFEGQTPQLPSYSVGASTGTSGNRGLYVVSDTEREEWLGVMLAKTLARYPLETARIALILPLNSALYKTAARTFGLALRFFDLNTGLDTILPQVTAFAPDTIIAPPKVLRALAESRPSLPVKRLFSAAEVLDPLDREFVERHLGVPIREIYMATEGLLGVACDHGTLHLCEDVMHFEFEPVPGSGLVTPIITDFMRQTQAMCRYRLNDLLRLADHACPCGSPYRPLAEIVGRHDDLFILDGRRVTPDVLRNAVVDADRRIADFRLRQTGNMEIELVLPSDIANDAAAKAMVSLTECLAALDIEAVIHLRRESLSTSARKLRRVERLWMS